MKVEIAIAGESRAERRKPWWRRRRVRMVGAVLAGGGIALLCPHLPEAYQGACKLLTRLLELTGAA